MAHLLVKNGIVVNSIAPPAGAWQPPDGCILVEGDGAIGDLWDGTRFSPPPPIPPSALDVDAERDRRIATTFRFQARAFQLDAGSQLNVTAMGSIARFAVLAGAAAGNLRWADPAVDFGWIATDNTVVPMDAPTMTAFSDAVRAWVSGHIFAARALKNAAPIPADFAADGHWPAA